MGWTPAPTAHFSCNPGQKVTLQINSLIQHRCPRFIPLQHTEFILYQTPQGFTKKVRAGVNVSWGGSCSSSSHPSFPDLYKLLQTAHRLHSFKSRTQTGRRSPISPGKRHRSCFCIRTNCAVASLSFQTCQSTPNPEDFFPRSTLLSLVHVASSVPVKQWPVAQTNICEGSENRTCPTKHI